MSGRTSRGLLQSGDLFNPDIAETVRVHLEENEIPGVVATGDGDGQTIVCVTTPRVIKDIRTGTTSKWLEAPGIRRRHPQVHLRSGLLGRRPLRQDQPPAPAQPRRGHNPDDPGAGRPRRLRRGSDRGRGLHRWPVQRRALHPIRRRRRGQLLRSGRQVHHRPLAERRRSRRRSGGRRWHPGNPPHRRHGHGQRPPHPGQAPA